MPNTQYPPAVNNGTARIQPVNSSVLAGVESRVNQFVNTLCDVFNDITALEVNTMVVSQISGNKFMPDKTYCEIHAIPDVSKPDGQKQLDQYLARHDIDSGLRDRYISFRNQLQKAYQQVLPSLTGNLAALDCKPTPELPDPDRPEDRPILDALLEEGEFLRALRKLAELKALAKGEDAAKDNAIDIICAQTVIQLDGDVINRFHEHLFTHSDKDFIIQVHREAVTSGEANWRGLLKFTLETVKDILDWQKPRSR